MSRSLASRALSFDEPPPGPGGSTMSPAHFRRIAALIETRTGIRVPDAKVHLIEGRLIRRAREAGQPTIDDYCETVLAAAPDDPLLIEFFNAVTTNKTDFFREPAHFDFVRKHIVPDAIAAGDRLIRCWSAAASIGMEAFTLAMVLADALRTPGNPDFAILATDLDTRVLAEARRGVYRLADIAPVPPAMRAAYMANARDRTRQEVRMIPALRRKVSFARLNLMDERYDIGEPMDVIFCRNVLIYFDKPTQAKVIGRLCRVLRPGGHLMLGHSETIHGLDLPLTPVGHTVFRRKD